jgi:hypothetical protein
VGSFGGGAERRSVRLAANPLELESVLETGKSPAIETKMSEGFTEVVKKAVAETPWVRK